MVREILIIEDNHDDADFVKEFLRAAGVPKVEVVFDGGLAIDRLRERVEFRQAPPDAVILDLNLPVTSGYEVLRFLKRTPELAGTRIIVLSKLNTANEIQICYYMGARSYVDKRTEIAQIQAQLRDALGLSSSAQA